MAHAKRITEQLRRLITGPRLYMGGGESSGQKAPNPYETAKAQFNYNKKQSIWDAKMNRYTQVNPLGTVSWVNSGTEKDPKWTQTTTLSPEQQSLYNTQMATQNNLATQAGGYADRLQGMLSSDPTGGDLSTRDHVEKALMERLNPYLEQDRQNLENQLANQGLTYGGEAYQRAMLDQSKRTNDARLAVIAQAGDEMQRSQAMENSRRNQGLTELAALIQGSGNVNLPQYGGATTISGGTTPDIAGLINANYQSQLSAANASQGSKNGLLSSGMRAAGSIIGGKMSDIRAKENIEHVGSQNGFNLYEFNYKGEDTRYRGVMAQEVAAIKPEAIVYGDDGLMRVDYDQLGFDMVRV